MEKLFLGVLNGVSDRVLLAVRGVLDFIYYAHFETHTDASLAKLTEAWNLFHDNKDVFVENDARSQDHFNISKIHAMQHYLGYRASNRKNYFKQMTKWLTRRETVYRFAAFLEWAVPPGPADPDSDEDEPPASSAPTGAAPVTDRGAPEFTVAKAAPFQVSVETLETEFGAADFLRHLEIFLRIHNRLPSNCHT
uniref:Uncharacterized protein n=1 Tax=Mycena chlorophos TaxID=658473 RepID=A0ABQ0L1V1_MYCCL|nr:predicted protein [Mycena chlorophos]